MKKTINFYDFEQAFRDYDRIDNFSREGLETLFCYLEEVSPDFELDVIAICCDFSQCSLDEFIDGFCIEVDDADEEDKRAYISDFINSHGFFYSFVEGGKEVVFQNF